MNENKKETEADANKNMETKINSYPSGFSFYKELIGDNLLANRYIIFKSINDKLLLTYINEKNSIISYDLESFTKKNEIVTNFYTDIVDLTHCLDKDNKRDLIMVTAYENIIQVWDINKMECLTNIEIQPEDGCHIVSCFTNYNNNLNVFITKRYSSENPFLIYDIKGNKIKEINNSYKNISIINNYYSPKSNNTYILLINNTIQSFNLNENKEYHLYKNDFKERLFPDVIIDDNDEITKLIGLYEKHIQIWNFHLGEKICNIDLLLGDVNYNVNYICNLDADLYLILLRSWTNSNTIIKLFDLKNKKIIKNLYNSENEMLFCVKKLSHHSLGEALIVSTNNNKIKLLLPINK